MVHDLEHSGGAAICHSVYDYVVAPGMVPVHRPQSDARAVSKPEPSSPLHQRAVSSSYRSTRSASRALGQQLRRGRRQKREISVSKSPTRVRLAWEPDNDASPFAFCLLRVGSAPIVPRHPDQTPWFLETSLWQIIRRATGLTF